MPFRGKNIRVYGRETSLCEGERKKDLFFTSKKETQLLHRDSTVEGGKNFLLEKKFSRTRGKNYRKERHFGNSRGRGASVFDKGVRVFAEEQARPEREESAK